MLTTKDRCDKCGSAATMRAFLPKDSLCFCSHHGRQYMGDMISIHGVHFEFTNDYEEFHKQGA